MSEDTVVSGVDQKKAKRGRPAPDAGLAVNAARLHDLVEAAAKHAAKDPELAAALTHFEA